MDNAEKQLSRGDALAWASEELGITNGIELVEVARYIRNED